MHFNCKHSTLDEYKACFSANLLFEVCSTSAGVCSSVYQLVMVGWKIKTFN